MKGKVWDYESEKGKKLAAGTLLLAEPFMPDENFRRSVVLICDHNEETGSIGLVLNRPVKINLSEVVDGFPAFDAYVSIGGPVGTDSLQFVHSIGERIEGSVRIADKLYWGGDFEMLTELVVTGQITKNEVCFYIGYSGWGTGQLTEELKSNSWIMAQAKHHHVFKTKPGLLWKTIMDEMGGIYTIMAAYPENPNLN